MKFKAASIILFIYAFIGLAIAVLADFNNTIAYAVVTVLYVLIPIYGGWGVWRRQSKAIAISMLLFVTQSFRLIDKQSIVPHISPITISFPITDFSQGSGYFIDIFAIGMAAYLAWLLKLNSLSNK